MLIHNSIRASRRRHLVLAALSLIAVVRPAVVAAQETVVKDPRDTTHAQTQAPFFTLKDAVLAGGFVGATALMFPLDKRIAF
jgi:hypothetical protein